MSEFRVCVVRIGDVKKHPNADTLSITTVNEGYPVIFKTGDFHPGDLAVYLPVDSIVPEEERWGFLGSKRRVRASRIRGVFSMGLLTALPEGDYPPGTDMAEVMGVTKYEPPLSPAGSGGEAEKDPGFMPVYTDIEGLRRWPDILQPGEPVAITEKLHGCLTANTSVSMADGSEKAISAIEPGDLVSAYNQETKGFEACSVLRMIRQQATKKVRWLRVVLENGGVLEITTDHQVLTSVGWKAAGVLEIDDDLVEL